MNRLIYFLFIMFATGSLFGATSFTVNGPSAVAPTNLALPGWFSVTNRITNNVLTASKIVLSGSGKELLSSAFGESDLANFATSAVTNGLATINYVTDTVNFASNALLVITISSTNGLSRELQFNANQFTLVNLTNINISDGVLLTNPVVRFFNGTDFTTIQNDTAGGLNINASPYSGSLVLRISVSGQVTLNPLDVNSFELLYVDDDKILRSYPTSMFVSATNGTMRFEFGSDYTTLGTDGAGGFKVVTSDAGGQVFGIAKDGNITLGPLGSVGASKLLRTDSSQRIRSSTYDETDFALASTTNGFIKVQSGKGNNTILTNLSTYSTLTANGSISFGTGDGTLATDSSITTLGNIISSAGKGSFAGITNTAGNNGKLVVYGTGGVLQSATSTDSDIIDKASTSALNTTSNALVNIATNNVRVKPGIGTTVTTNYESSGITYQVNDTEVASTMVRTNFVLNQVYTNDSVQPILIKADVFLTEAAVNGGVSLDLMYSITGGTGYTLLSRVASTTLLTGVAGSVTNTIAGVATNAGSYYFTNTSSGIGNSAGLVGNGTGQYVIIGGGAVGPTGATGAAGSMGISLQATNFGSNIGSGSNLVVIVESNLTMFATNTTTAGGTNSIKFNTAQPLTATASPSFAALQVSGLTSVDSLRVTNVSTLVGAVAHQSTTTNTGAINNGGIITNYPSSTTTVPQYTALAGGHNADAFTILQGPSAVGGFNSNGLAWFWPSNASVVYPATYRIFNQTADGSCTNITTVETSWFGTGVGSLTLPAGFWQVGRSVKIEMKGQHWTGTPLNNLIQLKLGSKSIATNLPISLISSLVAEMFEAEFILTCRTNSATVGYIQAQGRFSFPTASGGGIYGFRFMKSTQPIFDTTAAMLLDVTSTNGASTTSFMIKDATVTVIP